MRPSPDMGEIAAALSIHDLILRGGFNFDRGEVAPVDPSGGTARSVLLVGNAGAGYWQRFRDWRASRPRDLQNPLDSWSREVIDDVAARFGARAVYPSEKPYQPFQQWAMRAQGLKPSPLGILMHPEFGLWHAYRGALLFPDEVLIQAAEKPIHLCDLCVGKPCLKSCPVDAYSVDGFAHGSCLAHVRGAGGEPCRSGGCLDRNACPYGVAYRYPSEVQAFHMASFAGLA